MHFGFNLDSSDKDLWDIDLLDTDLDLLDTDILSKYFVCLQDILKMSWRHVLKTSWRHVFRRLQGVSMKSWKTKNCYAKDVLKTSSRYVLKTNKCLLGLVMEIGGYVS